MPGLVLPEPRLRPQELIHRRRDVELVVRDLESIRAWPDTTRSAAGPSAVRSRDTKTWSAASG